MKDEGKVEAVKGLGYPGEGSDIQWTDFWSVSRNQYLVIKVLRENPLLRLACSNYREE